MTEENVFLPEQYGSYKNGVLCLNSKYSPIHPQKISTNIFNLKNWSLCILCLIIGIVLNYWNKNMIFSFFISSIITLLYSELSNKYFKHHQRETTAPSKPSPIEDENIMAAINVANCHISIRKVKINEDGSILFRLTITHKTLRWHVWRYE